MQRIYTEYNGTINSVTALLLLRSYRNGTINSVTALLLLRSYCNGTINSVTALLLLRSYCNGSIEKKYETVKRNGRVQVRTTVGSDYCVCVSVVAVGMHPIPY
jgi:hypothetical protein